MWNVSNQQLEQLFKKEFEGFGFKYNVPVKKEELFNYLDNQIVISVLRFSNFVRDTNPMTGRLLNSCLRGLILLIVEFVRLRILLMCFWKQNVSWFKDCKNPILNWWNIKPKNEMLWKDSRSWIVAKLSKNSLWWQVWFMLNF